MAHAGLFIVLPSLAIHDLAYVKDMSPSTRVKPRSSLDSISLVQSDRNGGYLGEYAVLAAYFCRILTNSPMIETNSSSSLENVWSRLFCLSRMKFVASLMPRKKAWWIWYMSGYIQVRPCSHSHRYISFGAYPAGIFVSILLPAQPGEHSRSRSRSSSNGGAGCTINLHGRSSQAFLQRRPSFAIFTATASHFLNTLQQVYNITQCQAGNVEGTDEFNRGLVYRN